MRVQCGARRSFTRYREGVTEQLERQAPTDVVIAEALAVIDEALGRIMARELMSSGEVADLLLDVRTRLTQEAEAATN